MATTTLSAVDKHGDLTLSLDRLTVTKTIAGVAHRLIRGTTSHSNGRYYYEAFVNNTASNHAWGLANVGAPLANYLGSDANGIGMFGGSVYHTGANQGAIPGGYGNGDTWGIYADLDANYFRVKRLAPSATAWSSFFSLPANLGLAAEVFPACSMDTLNDSITFNFGASGFTGSIPSYMQSWDLAQTGLYVPGWDPMHKPDNVALSGSNLVATYGGALDFTTLRAMEGLRNGPSASGIDKVYWEVILGAYGADAVYAGLVKSTVGVSGISNMLHFHADAWGFSPNNTGLWHSNANTVATANVATPEVIQIAWNRATGGVWMKAITHAGWAGGGDPTAGTSPTFTLTGSEVYYPAASLRINLNTATLVYSGFAGGLPVDYVSIQDAVEDPDESPFPTPTPTPGGGGLPISEELAAYLGLPPRPHPPMVALTDTGGRPTKAFHDYLTQQYEWERRLYVVLTE